MEDLISAFERDLENIYNALVSKQRFPYDGVPLVFEKQYRMEFPRIDPDNIDASDSKVVENIRSTLNHFLEKRKFSQRSCVDVRVYRNRDLLCGLTISVLWINERRH